MKSLPPCTAAAGSRPMLTRLEDMVTEGLSDGDTVMVKGSNGSRMGLIVITPADRDFAVSKSGWRRV